MGKRPVGLEELLSMSVGCFYSDVATFFNFAKASVGSGSFALPWGILQAGVLIGSTGMALLGIAR